MVAPTYTIAGVTDVYTGNAGNFSAFGGGAGGLNTETDYYILDENDGTPSCQSKNAWASALKGMMHDENGTDLAVGTDEVVMVWMIYHVPNAISTNGMRVMVGTSTSVNWYFTVGDATSLLFETWVPWVVNFDASLHTGVNGSPSAAGTVDWVGGGVDINANGPTKGSPLGIDGIRYGRFTTEYKDGEAADYARFADAEATTNLGTNRWGTLMLLRGTYFMQGFHSFGISGTPVDFRDSDKVLFWRDTEFAPAGFNRIEIINASSNVDWDNISITALGTQSPGVFVHTAGTFDANNCQFIGMGTFDLIANSTIDDSKFEGCDQITFTGAGSLLRSRVLGSIVSADTGAVVWNTATNPDGNLDGVEFVSHDTTAHHAIEFGTNAPLTMTLRDMTFTGFTNTIGNSDAPLLFPDTGSDVTWNITANGCTGITADGYKKARAGDTVNITLDQVTLTIEARDSAGALITASTDFTLVTDAGTVLSFQEDEVDGIVTYVYTYVSDVDCYVNVVTSGAYVPTTSENVVLTANDATVTVIMSDDRVYDNP